MSSGFDLQPVVSLWGRRFMMRCRSSKQSRTSLLPACALVAEATERVRVPTERVRVRRFPSGRARLRRRWPPLVIDTPMSLICTHTPSIRGKVSRGTRTKRDPAPEAGGRGRVGQAAGLLMGVRGEHV